MPIALLGKFLIEENCTDTSEIFSHHRDATFEHLATLRDQSLPELLKIVEFIETSVGLKSDISCKANDKAVAKLNRPRTRKLYPWFKAAHLRDYLRFRTRLETIDDFTLVTRALVDLAGKGELGFVKADFAKLFRPTEFGWRMIALDLRLRSGMIVEHYMTFSDLIDLNDDWLHKVYERWRDVEITTMGEARARSRDSEFSRTVFRETFLNRAVSGLPTGSMLAQNRKSISARAFSAIAKYLQLEL